MQRCAKESSRPMIEPVSRILGTGHYLPPIVRTNHDLEKMVETSDAWIVERTGIRERRIAPEGIVTSDMATAAAKQALEAAELSASDLDMIIVATVTPDMPMPATAVFVHQKGQDIFKVAVKNLYSASKQALDMTGLTPDEVDWICPHQANLRIIDFAVARLGFDKETAKKKVLVNIDRVGNTSSASIPILLDENLRSRNINAGADVKYVAPDRIHKTHDGPGDDQRDQRPIAANPNNAHIPDGLVDDDGPKLHEDDDAPPGATRRVSCDFLVGDLVAETPLQ